MGNLAHVDRGISRSGAVHAPYEQPLFQELDSAIAFYDRRPDALIQILHRAQELFGYLRADAIAYIANALRLPLSQVYGVIGFYSFFSKVPTGKHIIKVCTGTACYVRGAEHLLRGLARELGIKPGETSSDGRFSLRCARCVGACGLAPVVMIGDDVHAKLRADRLKKTLGAYK